uniref:Malic enzyme n=1 Tax=Malurus cyaneus samueli TaxID=2593467 RepID=A0A8C5U8P6_9PASS
KGLFIIERPDIEKESDCSEEKTLTVVITDVERILGLGDLGVYGMEIPVEKLCLHAACAGIHPDKCLPVSIDVGTDNTTLLKDPFYMGLCQKRDLSQVHDILNDEFMGVITDRTTLIQFEDFGNHNKYCTFNYIQGTASVALAGLLAAQKATGKPLAEQKVLFLGAGEAALGIANLIVMAMMESGVSAEETCKKVWMFDKYGLLVQLGVHHALKYPSTDEQIPKTCVEAVKVVRPSLFSQDVNPTIKAACTAEEASMLTEVYVSLAVVLSSVRHISDKVFLEADKAWTEQLTDEELAQGRLYLLLYNIRELSIYIAVKVMKFLYANNMAFHYPEPADKNHYIRSKVWTYEYESFMPDVYDWPESKIH